MKAAGSATQQDAEQNMLIAHSLRADGFDASEDGTGRGTPLVTVPILEVGARTGKSTTDMRAGSGIGEPGDPMYTLQSGKQHAVFSVGLGSDVLHARDLAQPVTGRNGDPGCIAFDTTQITSKANRSNPKEGDPCHPLASGAHPPAVAFRASGQEGFTPSDIAPPITSTDGGGAGVPTVFTGLIEDRFEIGRFTCGECGCVFIGLLSTPCPECGGFSGTVSYPPVYNPSECDHDLRLAVTEIGTAVAFSSKDHGADAGEISPTLRSMGHDGSHANGGGQVAVAFQESKTGCREDESAGTLRSNGPGHDPVGTRVRSGMAVRRLTPEECEKLQGYEPGYTAIEYRGKPAADGPRYKALGNSMAVPCIEWLGNRIRSVLERPKQNG